jgi:methionyl aminopeptidase
MSIQKESDLNAMKKISEAVATTLREMRNYATPGITTRQLDDFGGIILKDFGALPAPKLAYGFPGNTCISINEEIAHGIPSSRTTLREGDLVNIDVSATLNGYWSDNGGSFVLGEDVGNRQHLVDTSRKILQNAIAAIKGGIRIAEVGGLIERDAKHAGYKVIKDLSGHGVGRKLHEEPFEIANYYNKFNKARFVKNAVVAIETFISTISTGTHTRRDGWTLVGNKGGYVAQHEHTIVVTDGPPIILTEMNGIWN